MMESMIHFVLANLQEAIFEACGLPLGSPDPEDNELVDALLRDGKPYRAG